MSNAQINFNGFEVNDWGDAPDTYQTLFASNRPSHVIVPGLTLGTLIDAENDGQPTIDARGDDVNGLPDEDGVQPATLFFANSSTPTITVTVTNNYQTGNPLAGQQAFLRCWMDLNGNGNFLDAGEASGQITIPLYSGSGSGTANYTVSFGSPLALPSGTNITYLRCRLSFTAAEITNPFGAATSGEVEDYLVYVKPAGTHVFDFGDAPEPVYPTTLASNGARHEITGNGLVMGTYVDAEPDGQPNATAMGDDINGTPNDEDAEPNGQPNATATGDNTNINGLPGTLNPPGDEDSIVSPPNSPPLQFWQNAGGTNHLKVTLSYLNPLPQDATICGWVDLNNNGVFDAGELQSVVVGAGPGSTVTLDFGPVPTVASTTTTFARFRIYPGDNVTCSPVGAAPDGGEVEDHEVIIHPKDTVPPICVLDHKITNGLVARIQDPNAGVVSIAQDAANTSNAAIVTPVVLATGSDCTGIPPIPGTSNALDAGLDRAYLVSL